MARPGSEVTGVARSSGCLTNSSNRMSWRFCSSTWWDSRLTTMVRKGILQGEVRGGGWRPSQVSSSCHQQIATGRCQHNGSTYPIFLSQQGDKHKVRGGTGGVCVRVWVCMREYLCVCGRGTSSERDRWPGGPAAAR